MTQYGNASVYGVDGTVQYDGAAAIAAFVGGIDGEQRSQFDEFMSGLGELIGFRKHDSRLYCNLIIVPKGGSGAGALDKAFKALKYPSEPSKITLSNIPDSAATDIGVSELVSGRKQTRRRAARPSTIGHGLLLCRIGSPLATDRPFDGDILHLIRAVYILSRPCAAAAAGLQRPRTRRLLTLWKWQTQLMCGQAHLRAAYETLDGHIAIAHASPEFWEKDNGGKKLSSPFLLLQKVRLMACFGRTAAEALDTPMREALWDMACHLEEQARVEWVSQEQSEAIARALN